MKTWKSKTMHSVAKTVCGIDLSQNTIEMIFTIFDDDGSKTLNRRYFQTVKWKIQKFSEFVDVMKARLERGLKNKRDFGFTNKLGAIFSCGCETYMPSVYKMFVEMEEHLVSGFKWLSLQPVHLQSCDSFFNIICLIQSAFFLSSSKYSNSPTDGHAGSRKSFQNTVAFYFFFICLSDATRKMRQIAR